MKTLYQMISSLEEEGKPKTTKKISVRKSRKTGRLFLYLDGSVQSVSVHNELTKSIWDSLVLPLVLTKDTGPINILLLGAGGFTTVNLADWLSSTGMCPPLGEIEFVEKDEDVLDAAHSFPEFTEVFSRRRVKHIGDDAWFFPNTGTKYSILIDDLLGTNGRFIAWSPGWRRTLKFFQPKWLVANLTYPSNKREIAERLLQLKTMYPYALSATHEGYDNWILIMSQSAPVNLEEKVGGFKAKGYTGKVTPIMWGRKMLV
jgi:hypothetical protein